MAVMNKKNYATRILINILVFSITLLLIGVIFITDKTVMTTNAMVNVSIGIVSLLGLSALCFVLNMDATPRDESYRLFMSLVIMVYLGVISDNIVWILRGIVDYNDQHTLFMIAGHVLSLVSYLLMPIVTVVFWNYQNRVSIDELKQSNSLRAIINILAVIDIILLLIGAATHILFYYDGNGFYKAGTAAVYAYIYPTMIIVLCIIANIRSKAPLKKKVSLLSFGLGPVVTIIMSLILPEYNFVYALSFVNLILIYGTVQSQKGVEYAERGRILAEQNEELLKQQTRIMISQIQPHFLYNTLTAIYQLCDINTELAQKTIQDFSEYLRGNMDGIKSNDPIPFEKELAHTKTYLSIELLRYGDILNVEYDIKVTDFTMPALTLQPLVENAVKYGVRSREEGGTISVSTWRQDGKVYVTVHDDGMGFDTAEKKNDGKSHLGIDNTRTRLHLMMNADLIIKSEIGVGTTAIIILEDTDESFTGR